MQRFIIDSYISSIHNGYFHKILYHTDLPACQCLFQHVEILLCLKRFFIFVHGGTEGLRFTVKLRHLRFRLQYSAFFQEIGIHGLCLCNLNFAFILEDRERKAYHQPIERCSRFRVPAVSQFQFGQPALFVDTDLLPGGGTFAGKCLQGRMER